MPGSFFGHPRGLATLFFSEMWERFSYYGMRGFLILYMTAATAVGGMGLDTATAAAIYGTYTSLVYLMSLPGGWIADRLIGQRRATLIGGLLIASGHYSLAVPIPLTFYLGLVLIVLGTGLLKPNISVIVGQLYAPDDVRRDAGFSLFYMGINLGAFMGPILTGYLAQSASFKNHLIAWGFDPRTAWHWGFGAAGIGMTLGVIQYVAGARHLGDAGMAPASPPSPALKRRAALWFGGGLLVIAAFGVALATGALVVSSKAITDGYGYLLLAITAAFFVWLFTSGDWSPAERRRLYLIGIFFLAAALFWAVYEQAGSTLNLFADRNTRNRVFGITFESSQWQSVNPFMIFVLAPTLAWFWVKLGDRQPASPTKFAIGLMGVGLAFLVMAPAGRLVSGGSTVGPGWLFTTYLLQTLAELCLSPVGLSSMTKLAPPRIVGLMMGVWFLAASVGNLLAGHAAAFYASMPLGPFFATFAAVALTGGLIMFAFRRPLARLIG
jgi:POT family proton-dependent oligopeptide transporter